MTGSPVRGTGRVQLSQFDESSQPLDPIVDKLLQQVPEKRPQSIIEVDEMIKLALRSFKCTESDEERILRLLRGFDK